METIISALRDLAKFKIVSSVNTGDKTYDNLIVVVLVSVFTFLFSSEFIKNLRVIYTAYYYKDVKNLETAQYISQKLENSPLELVPVERNTLAKLVIYMNDSCTYLYNKDYLHKNAFGVLTITDVRTGYENDIFSSPQSVLYTSVQSLVEPNKICPLFISNFGFVGIKGMSTTSKTSFIYFSYNSPSALREFKKVLNSITVEDVSVSQKAPKNELFMKLCYYNNSYGSFECSEKYLIYPDRSFDNIVSKHKNSILAHLKQFQEVNSGKRIFNGFGSYNLGILIYGLPGTGKTSFMKAICNHLNRHGHIYDMRTVKTGSHFKKIFQEVEKRVYIFDEFDCIQGVINREHSYDTGNENVNRKKELKDKLLSLLMIQHTEARETQNVTKEIESVKEELRQMEEALNLETLLTVLDGPCEMRNRIIVAATNYIDRIDPALLRPGRFDVKINLEEFNDEETIELLEKMFTGDDYHDHIKNHTFRRLTPTNIINICHELHDLQKVLKAISVSSK